MAGRRRLDRGGEGECEESKLAPVDRSRLNQSAPYIGLSHTPSPVAIQPLVMRARSAEAPMPSFPRCALPFVNTPTLGMSIRRFCRLPALPRRVPGTTTSRAVQQSPESL